MLSLLASIYGKVINLRNRLYDLGIFETFDLGARTISIGNITAGGTGKTPLVAYVAELLAASGENVCILTRGYGRKDAKNRVLVSSHTSLIGCHYLTETPPNSITTSSLLLAKTLIAHAPVQHVYFYLYEHSHAMVRCHVRAKEEAYHPAHIRTHW